MVFKKPKFFGKPPEIVKGGDDATRIEAQVASALADSGKVDASDVTVVLIAGEIVLRGRVDRPEDVAECRKIARSVPGVTSVRTELAVRSGTG